MTKCDTNIYLSWNKVVYYYKKKKKCQFSKKKQEWYILSLVHFDERLLRNDNPAFPGNTKLKNGIWIFDNKM